MLCPPFFVSDTMATSTPLSKANATFSLALLKKLSEKDKTANIFYSPFSISSALAMVMLGARGNTATQISEVQHTHSQDLQFSSVVFLSGCTYLQQRKGRTVCSLRGKTRGQASHCTIRNSDE